MSVASLSHSTKYAIQSFVATVTQKLVRLFSASTNVLYEVIWDEMTPPLKPDFCDKSIPGKCFYLVDSVYNYIFKVGIDTAGQVYVKTTSHDFDPVIYNKLKACVVDNAAAVADLIIKASAGDDRSSSTGRSPYSLFSSSPAGSNVVAYVAASDLTPSEESLVRTGFNALVEKCLNPTPSPTPQPCTSFFCTLGSVGGTIIFVVGFIILAFGLVRWSLRLHKSCKKNTRPEEQLPLIALDGLNQHQDKRLITAKHRLEIAKKKAIAESIYVIDDNFDNFHSFTEENYAYKGVTVTPRMIKMAHDYLNPGDEDDEFNLTLNFDCDVTWNRRHLASLAKLPLAIRNLRVNPTIVRGNNHLWSQLGEAIDPHDLINFFLTHTELNIRGEKIPLTKFHSGAIHSLKAALQYLLIMLELNKAQANFTDDGQKIIYIIDSRYMSTFDNLQGNFIVNHGHFIQAALDLIAPIGIINLNLFTQALFDNGMHFNLSFPGNMTGTRIQFIQLFLSPNNMFGLTFGYDDAASRKNLRTLLDICKKKITLPLQLPHTSSIQQDRYYQLDGDHELGRGEHKDRGDIDAGLPLSPVQNKLAIKWHGELTQIAQDRYCRNPCFYVANFFVKLGGFTLATAGYILTSLDTIPWGLYNWSKGKIFTFDSMISAGLSTLPRLSYGDKIDSHITGEYALVTGDGVERLVNITLKAVPSSDCKSAKDRSSAAQIIKAIKTAVMNHRGGLPEREIDVNPMQVGPNDFDANDFPIIDFELRDDAEKQLARKIFKQNIPRVITLFNNLVPGSKSLDGIEHLIAQAFDSPEGRVAIRQLLNGFQ